MGSNRSEWVWYHLKFCGIRDNGYGTRVYSAHLTARSAQGISDKQFG